MKHSLKIFSLLIAVVLMFSACDKDKYDKLAFSNNGSATSLTASSAAIAPIPADSNTIAVKYTWTDAKYATDSAHQKYVVEIDTAGGDFTNAARKTVIGNLSAEFKAKEINAILLSYGFPFNVAKNMIIRVTSSYVNNNEQYRSNILTASMTPYKVPPKIALPTTGRLFVVGSGTEYGWSNDATPTFPAGREFARPDETTFTGVFNLNANDGYKLLQEQGVWSSQFHAMSGGSAFAGQFEQKDADPTFPTPSTAGAYKVTVDFQTGKYTAVASAIPAFDALYITGDATAGNWTNDPPANQKFTKLNSAEYEITVALTTGKNYKFLVRPNSGSGPDWHPQIGSNSSTGGAIEYHTPEDSPTMSSPAESGNYKIKVNIFTGTYTIVKV